MSVHARHPEIAPTGLVELLTTLAKTTRAFCALELSTIGLRIGEDEVLMALDEARLVPVSQLAVKLDIRPSTAAKHVDRLASIGHVVRMDKAGTHPETLVRLSPAGAALRLRALAVRAGMEEVLRAASAARNTAALEESLSVATDLITGRLAELDAAK